MTYRGLPIDAIIFHIQQQADNDMIVMIEICLERESHKMVAQITLDDEKVTTLCQADERLKQLIHSVGPMENFSLEKNYYKSLVKRIIGQQVSLKVAAIFEKRDRKSTRLNSSHVSISYAVFCLKKKTKQHKCH